MSEEGKFWFRICLLVTVAFCTLVVGCVVNAIHEDNAISAAIAKGVNPVDVYCAYNGGGDKSEPQCILRSNK